MPAEVDPFDFPDPGSVPAGENNVMKPVAAKSDPVRLGAYAQEGEFTPMEEIAGQELLIRSIEPITTKFGEAFKVACLTPQGEIVYLCCGQTLIYPALLALLGDIEADRVAYPVAACFEKSGRTWTVS